MTLPETLELNKLKHLQNLNARRTGDYWEYHVMLEAWKRGAEVYMNQGATGTADLVIYYNGHLVRCDVKVFRKKKCAGIEGQYGAVSSHTGKAAHEKLKQGVYIIGVHPITCKVRWIETHEPAGLENFWNEIIN
tara:strand:+ start:60 stop:461 length:402 start_codon:yes stop_codon:yes gene_type:complete